MTEEEEKTISDLAEALGLEGTYKAEFEANALWLASDIAIRQILSKLPTQPKRDIRERQPILDYIRAQDGLGPWFEAGVLTRPLIAELSPRAYYKLTKYQAKFGLPDDVTIPTVHELVSRDTEMLKRTGADLTAVKLQAARTMTRLKRLGF